MKSQKFYLLFSPNCIPWAETALYYSLVGLKADIKMGLDWNYKSQKSKLIINPLTQLKSLKEKRVILHGKSVLRYFSRALKANDELYDSMQVDAWIDDFKTLSIETMTRKVEDQLKKSKYLLHQNEISVVDFMAWDYLITKSNKGKDDYSQILKGYIQRIEDLDGVKMARKQIENVMMGMDLIHSIKFEIASQIAKMIKKEDQLEFLYGIIEEPRDKKKGDLSLPIMRLRLNVNLNEYVKELSAKFKITEYITETVAENGFLHFKLDKGKLHKVVLRQIHELGKKFGQNAYGFGKFGVVEFSSPNIAKPFHAGHLRSTIIGNFVTHVLQANGWETLSINYLGDWGKQYGLLAVGFEKYGSDQELEKDAIRHLFDVYVKINADASENPEIHDQARAYFKRMEDGDENALALWQRFRDLSIEKYKEIYSRLNVSFDVYSGESQYSLNQMKDVLAELKSLKLLKPDQGALMVDLNEYKLGAAIIGKTDGSMLYLSRDIAANIHRKSIYDFDEMFYVVGTQQEHHFKQLFKILELMGKDSQSCHHVNFGLIKSKDGNMSTRKGSVVFLEDILNQVQEEMHSVMKKNEAKYAQIENPNYVADVVGMSSIIIQDMTARRHKDYEFDWNRMLSFEGDTGPYLQYAHARLCSIERAAFEAYGPLESPNLDLLVEPRALALLDLLLFYPPLLCEIRSNLEPNTLVSYILKLSHAISAALDSLYVLNREKDVAMARLYMYSAARKIMGNSLEILGLIPLERMADAELTKAMSFDQDFNDSFEGIEKVLEIIFSADQSSDAESDQVNAPPTIKKMKTSRGLLRISKNQWQSMLDKVKCQILDEIGNEYSTAYLLSESSLFVYEDRIIIKTCGTTTLLLALSIMIRMAYDQGLERIKALFYSRKGYMFPENQHYPHGTWEDEFDYIRSILITHGQYHIKSLEDSKDDWAIMIATPVSRSSEICEEQNMTLEIQMLDIDPQVTKQFYKNQMNIYKTSGISRIYPIAKVHDYIFDPCGYSLNGLLDQYYYTVHVTPENDCSYVSFESSIPLKEIDSTQKYSFKELVLEILDIFKPGNFTISLVSKKIVDQKLELKGFRLKDYLFSSSRDDLESTDNDIVENGWNVCFYSYEKFQRLDR